MLKSRQVYVKNLMRITPIIPAFSFVILSVIASVIVSGFCKCKNKIRNYAHGCKLFRDENLVIRAAKRPVGRTLSRKKPVLTHLIFLTEGAELPYPQALTTGFYFLISYE